MEALSRVNYGGITEGPQNDNKIRKREIGKLSRPHSMAHLEPRYHLTHIYYTRSRQKVDFAPYADIHYGTLALCRGGRFLIAPI